MSTRIAWLLFLLMLFFLPVNCLAANENLYSLGVRYGTNEATDKKTALKRYEVFGVFNLPWSWHIVSHVDLDTYLIFSGGILDGEGDSSFIGVLGPGVRFTDPQKRIALELSTGISLIPDYRLGGEDFGGPLQFIMDAGVEVRLFKHIGLSYKYHHFSDAAIFGSDNRGVDMHMLGVGYRFLPL